MKKLISLLFILSLWGSAIGQETLDFDKAVDLSKAKQKVLVLQFSGSDWCAPCIKLEKNILNTAVFEAYAEQYVWLKVDFPRRKENRLSKEQQKENDMLAERYNPNGLFPLIVFLDADQKVLASIKYLNVSPEAYIERIESILASKQ